MFHGGGGGHDLFTGPFWDLDDWRVLFVRICSDLSTGLFVNLSTLGLN